MKRKARRIIVKPGSKPKPAVQNGFGFEMPPDRSLVEIYFDQKGLAEEAAVFYSFYEEANWRSPKGTPYRNWKILATDWIFNYEQELKLQKRLRQNQSAFSGL
ncbi:MAG TPA: hypothetical protein VNW95_09585 [Mucilaginibacter sp.]|jgi:hypothetical protein|nr:hypothetical protein [Mucilaginibacter sp.]